VIIEAFYRFIPQVVREGQTMKSRTILLCLLMAATSVSAEVVNMANSDAGTSTQAGTPRRGTSQAGVAARFGEPKQRMAAVGQPPISRWVYDQFTVYFEGDRVIHAVINK